MENKKTSPDKVGYDLAKQLFGIDTCDWPTRGTTNETIIRNCVECAFIELGSFGEEYLRRAYEVMALEDFDSPELTKITDLEDKWFKECQELTGINTVLGCNFVVYPQSPID